MVQIRRFLSLSTRHQFFLIKTACLVGLIRLGLWFLPFQTLRQLLEKIARPRGEPQSSNQGVVDRIVRAVDVSSHFIPQATCLTQALATQVLLSRYGYPVDLRVGVAKDKAGQLKAHAWVESEGRIVMGGADSPAYYTAFSSLEGKSQ